MVTVDRYDSMDGQVALVTGATRGIGEETAARLVELGATVYAGARDVDDVTDEKQRPVELDVTDDGAMNRAVEEIEGREGRLDVLVNNAGVAGPKAPLHENRPEEIDATLAVNLRGPVVLTALALPLLLARPGGRW